jgi:hypothetical protein
VKKIFLAQYRVNFSRVTALGLAASLCWLVSACANRGYSLSEQLPLRNEKLETRTDLVKVSETVYVQQEVVEAYAAKHASEKNRELSSVKSGQHITENYSQISNTSSPEQPALLIYF